MGTAGSYSPVPGHRPRELWPANMDLPQRYCAGCRGARVRLRVHSFPPFPPPPPSFLWWLPVMLRATARLRVFAAPLQAARGHLFGVVARAWDAYVFLRAAAGDHDPENEMNPLWEPYTPTQRLACLGQLQSDFVKALLNRQLCVALNDDSRVNPVRWTWVVTDGDGDDVQVRICEGWGLSCCVQTAACGGTGGVQVRPVLLRGPGGCALQGSGEGCCSDSDGVCTRLQAAGELCSCKLCRGGGQDHQTRVVRRARLQRASARGRRARDP